MSKRVRSTVLAWPKQNKFKAQVYVDNYPVDREFCATEAEAQAWCEKREQELRTVVRE